MTHWAGSKILHPQPTFLLFGIFIISRPDLKLKSKKATQGAKDPLKLIKFLFSVFFYLRFPRGATNLLVHRKSNTFQKTFISFNFFGGHPGALKGMHFS